MALHDLSEPVLSGGCPSFTTRDLISDVPGIGMLCMIWAVLIHSYLHTFTGLARVKKQKPICYHPLTYEQNHANEKVASLFSASFLVYLSLNRIF